MIRQLSFFAVAVILSGCASASTTHSWSCRATGADVCASIATIDSRHDNDAQAKKTQGIFGGHVSSWWDQNRPLAETQEGAPRRESDQAMRIVIAPYVDGQGDYHGRADVYAVMRKAQWWIAPPAPVGTETAAKVPSPAASAADGNKEGTKP